MPGRQEHEREVRSFLQNHFPTQHWNFSLPQGSGMETYFVQGDGQHYFVKVGVSVARYLVMAEIGLTPPILSFGQLESGSSIIVQPFIAGHTPSRKDYREQVRRVAAIIRTLHHHPLLQETLQPPVSNLHKDAGLQALNSLRQTWEWYRLQVPRVAEFVAT